MTKFEQQALLFFITFTFINAYAQKVSTNGDGSSGSGTSGNGTPLSGTSENESTVKENSYDYEEQSSGEFGNEDIYLNYLEFINVLNGNYDLNSIEGIAQQPYILLVRLDETGLENSKRNSEECIAENIDQVFINQ